MKILIFIFFFHIFTEATLVAQKVDSVKVISIPRGSTLPKGFLPSPNSVAYKHNTPYVSKESDFILLVESFISGEKQPVKWIDKQFLLKGKRVVFEIVPDMYEEGKLLIAFNFPGYTRMEHKQPQPGYTFKWINYLPVSEEVMETYVPLMIIYEDTATGTIEKQLDILTKNKQLFPSMNSKLEKDIFRTLKNYYLIAYKLSEHQL